MAAKKTTDTEQKNPPKTKAKTTTLRVLKDTEIEDVPYRPNELVELDAKLAGPLVDEQMCDDSKEGIAYCKQQGYEPVDHAEQKAQRTAARAAEQRRAKPAKP